ncbi:MAG: DciA family protein [Alysiella sp.]|uniref:DciA family protein n=1 Tax=Alysiella sp. TaxID=1872483 RepID=UPI0026DCCB87|nr:DciA family protein [Alysiella sp.]MDO4434013.1 DciA family protein [Alysiella sp.]
MQLDKHTDEHLRGLIQRTRYWKQLDNELKQFLPVPLHPHLRVVCVENGKLVIYSTSPMAATRLKMLLPTLFPQLQALNTQIQSVQIKIRPPETEKSQQKNFRISPRALSAFEQTAHRLNSQHPELAAAMRRLVQHNK